MTTAIPRATAKAAIATAAKQRYDATYGATRVPLPEGIEEQAEFFFQRGELATVYFAKLIDQNAFTLSFTNASDVLNVQSGGILGGAKSFRDKAGSSSSRCGL